MAPSNNNHDSNNTNDCIALESSPLLTSSVQASSEKSYLTSSSSSSSASSSSSDGNEESSGGSASFVDTVMNISKLCMGTGTLALAYAAKEGGIVLFTIGLLMISLWNCYSVQRLVDSLQFIPLNVANKKADEEDCHKKVGQIQVVMNHHDGDDNNNDNNSSQPLELELQQQKQQEQKQLSTKLSELLAKLVPPPPEGTSTFGIVTYYAIGSLAVTSTISSSSQQHNHYKVTAKANTDTQQQQQQHSSKFLGTLGLYILDILLLTLFIGVIVAYIDGIRNFLNDTPITSGSNTMDVIMLAVIISSMSIVKDMGVLSKISATGLFVLFLTLSIITMYGVIRYIHNTSNDDTSLSSYNWFKPNNGLVGISHYFGCVVFGYGATPMTYNIQSSMKQPSQMVSATFHALYIVGFSYIIIGVGMYILFEDINADVLHELPISYDYRYDNLQELVLQIILPIVTRLAMIIVILVTTPLIIVPCGELLEGKLIALLIHHTYYLDDDMKSLLFKDNNRLVVILVRFAICFVCVAISILIPQFVAVLSLVGCGSVSLIGFVIPPLLHLILLLQQYNILSTRETGQSYSNNSGGLSDHHHSSTKCRVVRDIFIDVGMLVWGLAATVITTIYNIRHLNSGG